MTSSNPEKMPASLKAVKPTSPPFKTTTEEPYSETDTFYQILFENSEDGMMLTAPDGRIFDANPAASRITGYSKGEMIQMGRSAILDVLDPRKKVFLKQRERDGHARGELNLRHKSGVIIQVEISSRIFYLKNGETRTSLSFRDITIQKQYEAYLQKLAFAHGSVDPSLAETQEQQNELREKLGEVNADLQQIVARNMAEGVCVVRISDTMILYANPKFERMFGYLSGELNNQPVHLINYEDETIDAQAVAVQLLDRIKLTGEATYEIHNVKKDGTPFWCQATSCLIEHPIYGTILVAVQQDITERKGMEEKLHQSYQLYRQLVANLPDSSVLVFDHNLRYILAVGSLLIESGFQEREIEGRTIWEVLPSESAIRLQPYYQAALGGIEHRFEDEFNERVYLVRALPMRNEQGEIFAGMMLTQDITLLKQTEKAALVEKENLAITLRSIGDGVITTDLNSKVVLMNSVAENLTGWSQLESKGLPLDKVFHLINEKTRQSTSSPVQRALASNEIVQMENHLLLLARDGTSHAIADSSAPIRDHNNEVIGAVLVFRDVTLEQLLAEELLKTSKLEALGVLAGGIAHDFNNLLTAILVNLNLAKIVANTPITSFAELHRYVSEVTGLIEDAEKATWRSKNITQQLLTFAKGGAPIKKHTYLAQLVKDSATFVLHGSGVGCQFLFDKLLWSVEADEGQLSQVIQNLVLNAIQSFSSELPSSTLEEAEKTNKASTLIQNNTTSQHQIEIGGQNLELLNNQLPPLEAGKYVRFWVKDNGKGINPEDLSRIFDPYFTTKENGSGLGLAVCYAVVQKHGGFITVESHLADSTTYTHGTTFNIYIPALAEFSKPVNSTPAHTNLQNGNTRQLPLAPLVKNVRILIMDDEVILTNVLKKILSKVGSEAVIASEGKIALQLYREAQEVGKPFDMVILDLTIPGGLGGKETMKRLLELNPQVKAVVSSGYSKDPIMSNYREFGFQGILIKPFQIQDIYNLLDHLLSS